MPSHQKLDDKCYFCQSPCEILKDELYYRFRAQVYDCPFCGVYYLDDSAKECDKEEQTKIAQLLAENKIRNQKGYALFKFDDYQINENKEICQRELTAITTAELLKTYPKDAEKLFRVLETLKIAIQPPWSGKNFGSAQYAWAFCQNPQDFRQLLQFLKDQEYITFSKIESFITIFLGKKLNMPLETSKNSTTITGNHSVINVINESQNVNINTTVNDDRQSILKMIAELRQKCESLAQEIKDEIDLALDSLESQVVSKTPIIEKVEKACRILTRVKNVGASINNLITALTKQITGFFGF